MKRTLLAVTALLVSLQALAGVAVECTELATWGERGIPASLTLRGTHVIAADGRGLIVWDGSNPSVIRQVAAVRTSAPSEAVALGLDSALVLTSQGLELFEIGPTFELSRIDSREDPTVQAIAANASLFATAGSALALWQKVGGKLVEVGAAPLASPALSLFIDQEHAFVGSQNEGVTIWDLTGLDSGPIATIPVTAFGIVRRGDYLYVAGGGSGLQTIDVSDLSLPKILPRVLSGTSDLRELAIAGDQLYAVDHLEGSRVDSFSLSNPAAPTFDGALEQPADSIVANQSSLYVSGRLHLPGRELDATGSPLRVFTTDFPAEMKGEILDYAGPLSGVALAGPFAFVADPPLLRVIDFHNPFDPREVASAPLFDSADRLRLQGSRLLAYGRGNVHMFDVSDPRRPLFLGVFRSLGTIPEGAAMAGEYLVEDNRATGFHVLDVSDPSSPRQISGMINDPQNGQFFGLVAGERTVYAFTGRGIKVIDLTDPYKARLDHVIPTNRIAEAAIAAPTASHPELLLLLEPDRMRIFDLSDPLRPNELRPVSLASGVAVDADGDVAWVATSARTVVRVDLGNPAASSITSTIEGFSGPLQLSVSGDRIAVADSYSLRILEDPGSAPGIPDGQPELRLEQASPTIATLSWTGTEGAVWELAVSNEPTFVAAEVSRTAARSLSIVLGTSPKSVRVRRVSGCSDGPWSNVITIDPAQLAAERSLCFAGSGQVVAAGSMPFTVSVPVTNHSPDAASVTILAPDESVTVPPTTTIAPGSTALAEVSVDPRLGAARAGSITLGLDNSGCSYRLIVRESSAVTVAPGFAEGSLLLGGVAATPGSNGTSWKSDLSLLCRSAPCDFTVIYHAFGEPPSAAPAFSLDLEEGQSVLLEDVLRTMFEKETTIGTLEIRERHRGAILASATTYNDGPVGRYGQRIYGQHADQLASASRRLLGVAWNERFRTNLGLVDSSGSPHTVILKAVSVDGSTIATAVRDLAPWEGIQLSFPDYFPSVTAPFVGSVVIEQAGGVLAYASRVDDQTGDGTYSLAIDRGSPVPPEEFPRHSRRMSVVASTPGAAGTEWRTGLQIVSEGDSTADFTLTFIPSSDVSEAVTAVYALAPGQSLLTDDLFADIFPGAPGSPSPYGTLTAVSSASFIGWGRIYNVGEKGTLGQYVPLSLDSPARRASDRGIEASPYGKAGFSEDPWSEQILPVADTAQVRTNFGLVETAGKPASVALEFYDSTGQLLGVAERSLPPLASQPLFDTLADLGLTGVKNLRVEIGHRGPGHILVYASVVQRSTGDAVYEAAQ